jgi:hypothetical protein
MLLLLLLMATAAATARILLEKEGSNSISIYIKNFYGINQGQT